jgi:hypothetical protein
MRSYSATEGPFFAPEKNLDKAEFFFLICHCLARQNKNKESP